MDRTPYRGAIVTAIASRDIGNAKRVATTYKITKAHGSYDDLLADKDIDAVYISLPNGMHAGRPQNLRSTCTKI